MAFFVYKSPVTKDLVKMVDVASKTDSPVLFTGECGVGKSLLASMLGAGNGRPFLRLNCVVGDVFDVLKKSECKTALFEEVGALYDDEQQRLLSLVRDKELDGSPCNVRIAASSSEDLEQMAQDGNFNRELLSLLQTVWVRVPPLRERVDDIEPLAWHYLEEFAKQQKKNFEGFSQEALDLLKGYPWHGNITELKNAVERACIYAVPPLVRSADLRLVDARIPLLPELASLFVEGGHIELKDAVDIFKKSYVMSVLESTGSNQTKAAEVLGLQRTYLSRLVKRLGLRGLSL